VRTYIAYDTIVPRAISMERISFVLFLAAGVPIGIHHIFADPEARTFHGRAVVLWLVLRSIISIPKVVRTQTAADQR